MPLGAAKALLVEGFQSPQRLRDELAAGRMPCWDASGNAPGPEFWRSFEVNFEESMARTLLRISESGDAIYGPWHYGLTVSTAHVLALVAPPDPLTAAEASSLPTASVGAPAAAPAPPHAVPKAAPADVRWGRDTPGWARATVRRLRGEKKISEDIWAAELGRRLAAESRKDAKEGRLSRELTAGYLEDRLKPWGILPLGSFE